MTSEQKKTVKALDSFIQMNTELNYKVILGTNYHGTTSFDLDDLDKQRISEMLSVFVDNFYADYDPDAPSSTDGKTIEGQTIDTYSLGFMNTELYSMIENRTNTDSIIPVFINNETEEAVFVEHFISQAMTMNPDVFTDKTALKNNVLIRYQRFYVEKSKLKVQETDSKGNVVEVSYDELGYKEGLMVKLPNKYP